MSRLAIEIIIVVALLAGVGWYGHSQQQIILDRDAAIVAAKKVTNAEVEKRANELSRLAAAELASALRAPPSVGAPKLKCLRANVTARSAGTMPSDASSGPGVHAGLAIPETLSRDSEAIDYGPELDKLAADADAVVKSLQARVRREVGICR